MADLNEQLKKKATEKCRKDVLKFVTSIKDNPLFQAICQINVEVDGKKETLNQFFWNEDRTAGKLMVAANIEEYIETEATEFMERVEGFAQELAELKNEH